MPVREAPVRLTVVTSPAAEQETPRQEQGEEEAAAVVDQVERKLYGSEET